MDMKRAFLFASALLLAAVACNNIKTETYQDDVVVPLGEGQEDSLFFSMSIEYVVTGMKVEARQALNSTIVAQAFDMEGGNGTLEETAIRYRENLIDEDLNENAVLENGVRSWEDVLEGYFTEDYKGWKNYCITYYTFRGGAHGLQTVTQTVFNAKTGLTVKEADLFAPGYEEPVTALMQAEVRDAIEKGDPELLELVRMENVYPNGNFSVGPEGVEWVFQPYEVGPYVLGNVTVPLSWDLLKPYLK